MAEKREPSVTAPRATLGPVVPILRVADLAASVRYYVERLGFHVEWEAAVPTKYLVRAEDRVVMSSW
jgi:hypothetical protein